MQLRTYLSNLGISLGFSILAAATLPQMRGVSPLLSVPIFALPISILMHVAVGKVLPQLRRRSFMLTVAGQALTYLATIALSFAISLWLFIALKERVSPFDLEYLRAFFGVLGSPTVLAMLAAGFGLSLVIGGINQVSRKMGPGVLLSWITGRYHEPSEERRFFMFLDLKDSTTLGEQMGNLMFSALVRDFFADLTGPVVKTKGEVSHYIGDEAVLTWRMGRGAKKANCVRCFFLMRRAVEQRREHYLRRYGHFPEFKAGLHCGLVVATEVGEIKSEIVYHGDVLNTTARIQGACAGLGVDFLVSDDAKSALEAQEEFAFECLGPQSFKGKSEDVLVYAVRATEPPEQSMEIGKPGK